MGDLVEHSYSEKELELRQLRAAREAKSREQEQKAAAPVQPERQARPARTAASQPAASTEQQDATPVVTNPDMNRMVDSVSAAAKRLQDVSPSALSDSQKAGAGLTGAALLAWLAHKFIGGNEGGGDNSPKSRQTMREPQMDTTIKGRQEPTFAPEPVVQQAPKPAAIAELPQATIAGQQQPQMQYGQTTMNAPTGAPNPLPVAPPAEATPAAVAPKLLDAVTQAKVDKIAAETALINQRATQEAERHKTNLAKDAERAVKTQQKSQGKASTGLSNDANALVANAAEGKVKADLAESLKTKPVNPLPIGGTHIEVPNTLPVGNPPAAPTGAVTPPAEKAVLPISSNPEETRLTKEQRSARGWLEGQWGGAKNYFQGVQDIHGGVPPSYNPEKGEHGIGKDAHQVIMDWRKANIEGPKVNLTYDMKKAMKGAGGLAVLTAIPGFAEAAQNKDVGKMTDLFTDFFVLPFAQSRGTNEGEQQELAKRRYEGAVGGGRGIAPPSAYQR